MSMSGAEKAGLFGGVLLAAAVIAAGIILFGPEPGDAPEPPPKTPGVTGTPATGTAAPATAPAPVPERGKEPEPPTESEPPGEEEADLFREVSRLRGIIKVKDAEIERLQALLREAGVAFEEEQKEPVVAAREAIEALRRCGPETDTLEIEALVRQVVSAGAAAVPEIERFLEQDQDVKFTDTWTVLSGRLLGYPGMRLALIDALAQIGGVQGESSLVTALRGNEDPLEICLLVSYLQQVKNVPAVRDVLTAAARRYLELEPHRQERQIVVPLLGVLASLHPPTEAANALLAYIRSPHRNPAQAEVAIRLLDNLPDEVAIAALSALAVDRAIGRKAEDAVELLVLRDGAAFDAVTRIMEKCDPRVRGVVYRFLARPAQAKMQEARSRSVRSGLQALSLLDELDASIAARRALAEKWRDDEPESGLMSHLLSARSRLNKLVEESAALRKKLTVE
jgi:hypothetical protein